MKETLQKLNSKIKQYCEKNKLCYFDELVDLGPKLFDKSTKENISKVYYLVVHPEEIASLVAFRRGKTPDEAVMECSMFSHFIKVASFDANTQKIYIYEILQAGTVDRFFERKLV